MNKDLLAMIEYLEREKGIKREIIIKALEDSLVIAAKKSVHDIGNVSVTIHPKTGNIDVTAEKEIVETVEYPDEEISWEEAKEIDPDCQPGQWIEVTVTPNDFGRIAAQVARQVIMQKIRGAEKDVIHEEYRHRMNELVSGTVKRIKNYTVIVDLGKVEAILPGRHYPMSEKYHVGDKVVALLMEVADTTNGGAEVILSRTHPNFIEQLFIQEVPEVADGTIRIAKIVRDPGYKTKIAITCEDPKLDPVGACVGVRGARVKNIIRELNNEKIDIIPFSVDPIELLKNALHPIDPKKIELDEELQTVTIDIEDEEYPIVLGKRGSNARLIGELIGYELKVYRHSEYEKKAAVELRELASSEDPTLDEPLHVEGINPLVIDSLISAGFDTPRKLIGNTIESVVKSTNLSQELIQDVFEQLKKQRL